MKIERVTKGRTMTTVVVSGASGNRADEKPFLVPLAYQGAGERYADDGGSCFGWRVYYFDEDAPDGTLTAVVDLHTD